MSGEDVGNIQVSYSSLNAIQIKASLSPYLIDEYPILSVAASQAKGVTVMRGLSELRHKESDRIKSITTNLTKIGFKVTSKKDDISIKGSKEMRIINQKKIKTYGDHRIAMSFIILSLLSENKLVIDDEACILTSYPDFKKHLKKLIAY